MVNTPEFSRQALLIQPATQCRPQRPRPYINIRRTPAIMLEVVSANFMEGSPGPDGAGWPWWSAGSKKRPYSARICKHQERLKPSV